MLTINSYNGNYDFVEIIFQNHSIKYAQLKGTILLHFFPCLSSPTELIKGCHPSSSNDISSNASLSKFENVDVDYRVQYISVPGSV